jgi:hypothetical protein
MKKLLVVSIVFVIASLATADLTITGPSEVKVDGGTDNYAVYIAWTDAPIDASITLTTGWPGNTSDIIGYGSYPGSVFGQTALGVVDLELLLISSVVPGAMTAGYHATITAYLGDGLYLGTTDMGLGRIDLLDYSPIGIIDTVYVVPEPLTLGLLGIGGLFLRRKK